MADFGNSANLGPVLARSLTVTETPIVCTGLQTTGQITAASIVCSGNITAPNVGATTGPIDIGTNTLKCGAITTSGKETITDATDSSTTGTGALVVAGGLGVTKRANFGDKVKITGALDITDGSVSNDSTSGALIVTGGVGVGGNLNVAGSITGTVVLSSLFLPNYIMKVVKKDNWLPWGTGNPAAAGAPLCSLRMHQSSTDDFVSFRVRFGGILKDDQNHYSYVNEAVPSTSVFSAQISLQNSIISSTGTVGSIALSGDSGNVFFALTSVVNPPYVDVTFKMLGNITKDGTGTAWGYTSLICNIEVMNSDILTIY